MQADTTMEEESPPENSPEIVKILEKYHYLFGTNNIHGASSLASEVRVIRKGHVGIGLHVPSDVMC